MVGLYGIDTRALTRIIREHGVMNGRITKTTPLEVSLEEIRSYRIKTPCQMFPVPNRPFTKGMGQNTRLPCLILV